MKYPEDKVDPQPCTDAIIAARERGVPVAEITRLTGVRPATIRDLIEGKVKDPRFITRRTSDRIFQGLESDLSRDLRPNSLVDIKRSRQILHSLIAQGWTLEHCKHIIRNNTSHKAGGIMSVTRPGKRYVTKQTEDLCIWLANQIGDRTGPATVSATKMRNRGIFPTKHYGLKGDLLVFTLTKEQKALLERVQS